MLRYTIIGGMTLLFTTYLGAQQEQQPNAGQEPPMRTLQAPDGYFRTLTFSADGKKLAAGVMMGDKIYVWDIASGQIHTRMQLPRKNYDYNLAFSRDGRVLISEAREDEMVRIWDVANGKQLREVKRLGKRFFAFSPGGLFQAASGPKFFQGISIVETANGKQAREIKQGDCVGCAFSPDGLLLATHAGSGEINLWDPESGKLVRNIRKKPQYGAGAFNFIVFSPDGKHLASGGHIDKKLRIWDSTTGKERATLDCRGFFCSASFSPDGTMLASGSTDGLSLYDLVKDREICKLKPPFPGQFVAFSPDGSLLAVGGNKGNVYLYDMPRGRLTNLPKELGLAELENLLKDMGTKSDFRFQQVTAMLRAAPKDSVPFLGKKLTPVPESQHKRVLKIIADLDDEKFEVRDRAMENLQELAAHFEPLLAEQVRQQKPGEIRNRLSAVLGKLKETESPPDLLVATRTIGVLEQIGTPAARKVLTALAKGAAQARMTVEAQAALDRLAKAKKAL